MQSQSAKRRPKKQPLPLDGRDELNLAEFPIAVLTDRVPEGQNTLEFQDTIHDPQSGQAVTRKLTVSAPDAYGLPTAKDDEVILGLIQLTKLANGFTDRVVYFSRYDLMKLIGWPNTGFYYHRLEESLDRWTAVFLHYENAWWDHQSQRWVNARFHILSNAVTDREAARAAAKGRQKRKAKAEAAQLDLPFCSFTWDELLFKSFQSGYLKRLDLEFYLSLAHPTSRRMYRFLDKRFYHRPDWQFGLREFACDHVGFSRGYDNAQLRRKMQPAVEELEAKGFLEPLPEAQRYRQVRRGEWQVSFRKKAEAGGEAIKPPEAAQKLLVERGVTLATAAELAGAFPAERIAAKVEVFDWLKEGKDPRLGKNAAGYLVESVRKDYQPPQGFETAAQKEEKRLAGEKTRKALEESRRKQDEAKERQEAEAEARRRAKREHIDGYLQGLSHDGMEALEERAFAAADAGRRPFLHKQGPLGEAVRQGLIEEEVLRLRPLPVAEA